jgi:hypothetical protein
MKERGLSSGRRVDAGSQRVERPRRSSSMMQQMKSVWARALVLAPLALAFSARGDSIDVEIRSGDKVSGTIRPTYDQECFTCDLAKNTAVTAVVKGRSKTGPAFKTAFRQGFTDVTGTAFAPKAKGGTMKSLPVAASGQYQVCVFVDDGKDGDYDLVVTWKPQVAWITPGESLSGGSDASFTFSAPAGSTATIDVLPGKGSKLKGDLLDVTGPNAFLFDLSDLVEKHVVIPALPATGEYTVDFTNVGDAGTWTGRVKLKLPKFKLRKFDLRDSALGGAFAGDHTVVGREVDEAGGTVVVQTGGVSPLDGAGVSVPADSLAGPVVITVSAGNGIDTGDGSHASGPAVEFGPSGTQFDPSKSAQITIPFDPSFFPGGDTSTLVVYVRAANGTITPVPPPYVINGNTVTFSTSHFSTYQPATTNPRPLEGSFIAVEVSNRLDSSFQGEFGFGVHSVSATRGTAIVQNNEARIEWFNFGSEGAAAGLYNNTNQQSMSVSIKDDATVQLIDPQQSPPQTVTFQRGVSDDVLVAQNQTIVLLRRAAAHPTPATLAGTWHVFHPGFEASTGSGFPSAVQFELRSETGNVTFTTDGNLLLGSFRETTSDSGYQSGQWSSQTKTHSGDKGVTYSVDEAGRVNVTTPAGDPPFNLEAVLDGNVLVGVQSAGNSEGPGDVSASLFVMVRAAAGTTTAKIAGVYQLSQNTTDVVDHQASEEPPKTQDFQFSLTDFTATIAASGVVTLSGSTDVTTHDDNGNPVTAFDKPFSDTGRLTARSDGSVSSGDAFTGAVAVGGGFFVFMDPSSSGRHEIGFGLRLPPPMGIVAPGLAAPK